jgi:CheY-like chemotaxis protein
MTFQYTATRALKLLSITTFFYGAGVAQSTSPNRSSQECRMVDACNAMGVSARDCTVPRDERSCSRGIGLLGMSWNDPVCEAAKASQNQVYSGQKAACEVTKAVERSELEARRNACLSVARACSGVLRKGGASGMFGARILWVDDHSDTYLYERQGLAELGATIVPVNNTREALDLLKKRTESFDTVISDLVRSDDAHAGYTLLAAVLKIPEPPPYIIYSASSNAALTAEAKAKGAFGEARQAKELFELVITAVKEKRRRMQPKK